MVAIKLELLLFLNIFYVTDGERRITDGEKVNSDKSYVVYVVKAPSSNKRYDEWLCGGALVSLWFIITSAACVADVEYMYAIAGYKEYIPDNEIETNACTKETKKRVVYTCVPLKYELDYHKLDKWSFIDIGLVKVESAYQLNDEKFKTLCSYSPTVIAINYVDRFQKPGIDTLVYGWGHPKSFRALNDKNNYNERFMQFASSKIIEKSLCKTHYDKYENMNELIDRYMICTFNKGEINDVGEFTMLNPPPLLDGCNKDQLLSNPVILNGEIVQSTNTSVSNDSLLCEDDDLTYQNILVDNSRRGDEDTNQTSSDSLQNENKTVFNKTTRRHYGICQNDHGGPLVTWIGGHEVLIGVASVFKVDDDLNCNGPYLYSSTQCNGAFLSCILETESLTSRRSICDAPPIQRGYDTVEKHISWKQHPSGPADNERNAYVKREKEINVSESTQELRFDTMVKMAKYQPRAVLRQQRQRV